MNNIFMKRGPILAIALSISTLSFSQSREATEVKSLENISAKKESHLTLRLGIGNPTGDFGDDDFFDADAGLAKTGVMFEGEFFQELSESIFFSLMARFQINELDPDPFVDFYVDQLPSNVRVEVETTPYRLNNFMTGIGTISPINDNAALISRFLFGFSSIAFPTVEATLSDNSTTIVDKIESVNTTSFSYLVGLGLRLEIDNRTNLLIGADYFGTNAEFENVPSSSALNGNIVLRNSQDIELDMRLINLSIGIAIML